MEVSRVSFKRQEDDSVFEQIGFNVSTLAKNGYEVVRNELSLVGNSVTESLKVMGGLIVLLPLLLVSVTTGFVALAVSQGASVQSAAFTAAGVYAAALGGFILWCRYRTAAKKKIIEEKTLDAEEEFQLAKEGVYEALHEAKDRVIDAYHKANPLRAVKKSPEKYVLGTFAAGFLLAALTSKKNHKEYMK